ncbi:hypothetical protein E4T56_gene16575 [Termitomyces sp. T112]|nr:hypothetical protein E4T56_gene16575 [Termitomyces sp. T112]
MLHSTIRVSPFYANKGYNPQLMLSLKDIPSHVAHKVAKDLQSLHQFLCNKINTTNQAYSKHADAQCDPTPNWPPSTLVWLNQQNLKTQRPSIKLDYKCLGPFKVLQKVSMHAYKLDLLPGLKGLHPLLAAPPPSASPAPSTAAIIPTNPAPPVTSPQSSAWPPLAPFMPHPNPSMPHCTPTESHSNPPDLLLMQHQQMGQRLHLLLLEHFRDGGRGAKVPTRPPHQGPQPRGALPPEKGMPFISPCPAPWKPPLSTHPIGVPPSLWTALHCLHTPPQNPDPTPSPCAPQVTVQPPTLHPIPAPLIYRLPANSTKWGISHASINKGCTLTCPAGTPALAPQNNSTRHDKHKEYTIKSNQLKKLVQWHKMLTGAST